MKRFQWIQFRSIVASTSDRLVDWERHIWTPCAGTNGGAEAENRDFFTYELVGFSVNPTAEDRLLRVTDLCPNGLLKDALNQEHEGAEILLDASRKSKIIFGIESGMAYLHARGIIAGDLRSSAE
jgi:hypothetical protein